ncbi:2-dehydropantoate 2-reductase [Alphaproteobacteria bacterium GH1-50]|uniref:2-dehydropantoate 2-reductase n=1 Tax=Kangsaoukella pontilimi TaxID=2691042 RepID=A0A7C9ISB7_9RHOB|nr:ketopantoate reductase family protein [Kangsaoukella pontilimi]MXQ07805.1 2-dehydropantoate 2-reductase [Kangsaoukella pontilimi]
MSGDDYHVAVFGGGSVGLCLAAHFAVAGARVTLLVRDASIPTLRGKPITVTGLLGDHTIPAGTIALCDAARPTDDVLGADMLALTTKAQDVETALKPFAAAGTCPPLLLLQNGMGSAEIARQTVGPGAPVYSTAMMIGMVRGAPGEVEVTAQASPINCGALLGDATGLLDRMIDVAGAGFIPMRHDPAIRETIAFKLLFNCCMNPTGALTGQTYGELLENPDSRALIVGLADEALAAFAAAFDYRPAASGQDYVDTTLDKIVFPRGIKHRSSMLQDLQAGRTTEVDFLNGAVIRIAEEHGLSAARHETILSLIKARAATGEATRAG